MDAKSHTVLLRCAVCFVELGVFDLFIYLFSTYTMLLAIVLSQKNLEQLPFREV